MTIVRPTTGDSFEAELTEGARGILWVTAIRDRPRGHFTLRAIRGVGWEIVGVNEAERRLLEAHRQV